MRIHKSLQHGTEFVNSTKNTKFYLCVTTNIHN